MTHLSSTTSQGICSAAGHSVSCIFGFVAAGASASAAITVSQSEPIGNVSDTGSVSFAGIDDNQGNNFFTVTVKVQ